MKNDQLAKGFIHLMFDVPMEDVKTKGKRIITTTHTSREDNKQWKCQFKFKGGNVQWKWEKGRWRTLEEDIRLSYKESGNKVILFEETPLGTRRCEFEWNTSIFF